MEKLRLNRCQLWGALLALYCLTLGPCGLFGSSEYLLEKGHPLEDYFKYEIARIQNAPLQGIESLEDWEDRRETLQTEFLDMLGLWPMPERSDLKVEVTGVLEEPDFTVKKLHFQSLPGLYVTANLYLPAELEEPAPAILYVCGHARSVEDGVSFGNKVAYHHHAVWFAQNGYVCLIIDTIHLGEILGIHHGTYSEDMWWWNARGYTPAGSETWNSIRAIDYLESLPEVDSQRIGMTGRSGGGAYSWWAAAVDPRIAAVVPVAGITDLHNHVVDGVVEGHCDCMYFINTEEWDYPVVAALIAPRPLLIVNTDRDHIYPLDGVVRLHEQTRRIYELYGAEEDLGLLIAPGPHQDSQNLQLAALRWFNQHLKGDQSAITGAAKQRFEPKQLKVFAQIPDDSINNHVHDSFVPKASIDPNPSESRASWEAQMHGWKQELADRSFREWPEMAREPAPELERIFSNADIEVFTGKLAVHPKLKLDFWLLQPTGAGQSFERVELHVVQSIATEASVDQLLETVDASSGAIHLIFPPRGVGPNAWPGDERRQTHILRRFNLLGQTLEGTQVWDIRRIIQALGQIEATRGLPLYLYAEGEMGINALYASLFEEPLAGLTLTRPPQGHKQGPHYLNVLRILDIPQAMAMAAYRMPVALESTDASAWNYPQRLLDGFPDSPGSLQLSGARD
ncbi:MAG: acetylxylan esterase [Opitutales bacterium]|nr:acetylxylan esterase [Opitutales bacterium]